MVHGDLSIVVSSMDGGLSQLRLAALVSSSQSLQCCMDTPSAV